MSQNKGLFLPTTDIKVVSDEYNKILDKMYVWAIDRQCQMEAYLYKEDDLGLYRYANGRISIPSYSMQLTQLKRDTINRLIAIRGMWEDSGESATLPSVEITTTMRLIHILEMIDEARQKLRGM